MLIKKEKIIDIVAYYETVFSSKYWEHYCEILS